jgi:hypothetical protein
LLYGNLVLYRGTVVGKLGVSESGRKEVQAWVTWRR